MEDLSDKKALKRLQAGLQRIQNVKNLFRPAAGIVNGVLWGGTATLGGVSMMHGLAGHAAHATRFLGAAEYVAPYAVAASVATVAGHVVIKTLEKRQTEKIEGKKFDIAWKERLSASSKEPEGKEKEQAVSLDKTQTKTASQTKEAKKYRPFTTAIQRKQVADTQEMTM